MFSVKKAVSMILFLLLFSVTPAFSGEWPKVLNNDYRKGKSDQPEYVDKVFRIEGTGIIYDVKKGKNSDQIFILGTLQKSPANRAGIKRGGLILEINGRKPGKEGVYSSILNPPAGTKIKLKISMNRKIKNYVLESEEMEIERFIVPKLGINEGFVKSLTPPLITLDEKDGIAEGDRFFVFDGFKCMGTLKIKSVGGDNSTVEFETMEGIQKHMLSNGRILFYMPAEGKAPQRWLVKKP